MIEFPSWLEWLGAAIGMEWPHGNEDDMWSLAGDWHTAAGELREILSLMDDAKSATLAAYPSGDGQQQMIDTFDSMRHGKDSLEALAGYFDQVGDSVYGGGTQIEYTKLMFYSTLVITAADIAAVWIFPPTAPAEEAGIIVATRVAVRMMMRRVLDAMAGWAGRLAENALVRFMFRHVLLNAALGALQDFAVQQWQVWEGHRKSIDWQQLEVTTFAAGVGGAAGGAFGEAMGKKFGNAFRNEVGDVTSKWGVNLTRAGIGAGSGLVNSVAAFGGSVGWQFASDLAHGDLDTALKNLKNTHVDWRMFSAGAITGGASALNHNFAHSHFENSPFWKLNAPRADLGNIGDLHGFTHDGTVPNAHVDLANGNGAVPHGDSTAGAGGEQGSSGPVRGGPVTNGHDSHAGAPTTTAGTHERPASEAGGAPEQTASQHRSDTAEAGAPTPASERSGTEGSNPSSESATSNGPVSDSSSAPPTRNEPGGTHDSSPTDTTVPQSGVAHETATSATTSGSESASHASDAAPTESDAVAGPAASSGPAESASSAAASGTAASGPAEPASSAAASGPAASSGSSTASGASASSGPSTSSAGASTGSSATTGASTGSTSAAGASPIDARGPASGGTETPRTGDVRTPDARTATDGRAASDLGRGSATDARPQGRAGAADASAARPGADPRVQTKVGDSEGPRAANRAGASEGERITAKPDRADTAPPRDRGETAQPRDRGETAQPRDRGETAQPRDRAGAGPRTDQGRGTEPVRGAGERPETTRTPTKSDQPAAQRPDRATTRDETRAPSDESTPLRDPAEPAQRDPERREADTSTPHDRDEAFQRDPEQRDTGTSTPRDTDSAEPRVSEHAGPRDAEHVGPRDSLPHDERVPSRESDQAGRSAEESVTARDADSSVPRDADSAVPRDAGSSIPRDADTAVPHEGDSSAPRDADAAAPRDADSVASNRADEPGVRHDTADDAAGTPRDDTGDPARDHSHPDDSRAEHDGTQEKSSEHGAPRRRPAADTNHDGTVRKPVRGEIGEDGARRDRDDANGDRPEDQLVPGAPPMPAPVGDHPPVRPGRSEQPDHTGAPEAAKPAPPRPESTRGRCAELALRLIRDLTGSKTIRLPERAVGPEGMTAAEVQADAGGRMVKVGDHDAIARRLSRMRKGASALVVDGYHAGPGRRVVGAHAYVMVHEGGGRIVVRDPSTGVVTDHPASVPADLHDTHMILFDHRGRPIHPLTPEHREALARRQDPSAVRIRQALDDNVGRVHELLLRTPTGRRILGELTDRRFREHIDQGSHSDGRSGSFRRRDITAVLYAEGRGQIAQALTLAHESVHAERYLNGESPADRPLELSRDDYVREMVHEEAMASGRRFQLAAELRELGYDIAEHPAEVAYRQAYERALRGLEGSGAHEIAHEVAVDHLRNYLEHIPPNDSGRTYADHYRDIWDRAHDGARTPADRSIRYVPDDPVVRDRIRSAALERHIATVRLNEHAQELAHVADRVADRIPYDPTMRRDMVQHLISEQLRNVGRELGHDGPAPERRAELQRLAHDLRRMSDLVDRHHNALAEVDRLRASAAADVARRLLGDMIADAPGAELVGDHFAVIPGEPERIMVAAAPGDHERVMRAAPPEIVERLARPGLEAEHLNVDTRHNGEIRYERVDQPGPARDDPAEPVEPQDLAAQASEAIIGELRRKLAEVPVGAWAVDTLHARGVIIEHDSGGGHRYEPARNRLTLDIGGTDGEQMAALVHAAIHAERAHERGTGDGVLDRDRMSRDDYVSHMLDEETDAHAMEYNALAQLREAGHDIATSPLERIYRDAFTTARERAATRDDLPGDAAARAAELDRIANQAGVDAIRPAMGDHAPDGGASYAHGYGEAWDSAHPPREDAPTGQPPRPPAGPPEHRDGGGTSYANHYGGDTAYGIKGWVTESGVLHVEVRVGPDTPSGREMFRDLMIELGDRVEAIQAEWFDGGALTDNLDSFNAGVQEGLTPEEAARRTFTGTLAEELGYTEVTFGDPDLPGDSGLEGRLGENTGVTVLFRHPEGFDGAPHVDSPELPDGAGGAGRPPGETPTPGAAPGEPPRRAEVIVAVDGEHVRLRLVADGGGRWRVESVEPVREGEQAAGGEVEPAKPGRLRSLWQRFTGGYEGHYPKYPSGSGQDGKYQTEMTEDFGHLFDIHALETLGDHDISINYARLLKESFTLWINREHAPLLNHLTARMDLQAGEHIPMHGRDGREYAYWNEDADPAEVAAMHKYLRDIGLGHLVDESRPHDLPGRAVPQLGESEAPHGNPADELRAAADRLGVELSDISPETLRRALDTAEYQNLRRAAVIEALRDAAHRYNAEHADIPYRPQSITDHNPLGRFLKEVIIAQGDDPGLLNWRGVNNGAESGRDFDVLNVENPDERIEYDPDDESGRDQGLRTYFENALRRDQIRDERATWADLLAAELSRLEPDQLERALHDLRDGVHERAGEIGDFADQVAQFRERFPANDVRELPPERPGEPGRLVILDVHGDHEQTLAGALDRHPGLAARLDNGEVRAEKWTVVVDANNQAHIRHLGDIEGRAISVDVEGRHLDGLLVRDADGNWHVTQPPAEPAPVAPDARTPEQIRSVRDDLARELGLDPDRITPELIEHELRANDLRALQIEALLDHARSSDAIETFHDLANARDRLAQTSGIDDAQHATPERVAESIADRGTRNALRKQQVEQLVKYYDKLASYLKGRGEDPAHLAEARDNLVRALGGEPEDVFPKKYSKELDYQRNPQGIDPGELTSLIRGRLREPGTAAALTDFIRTLADADPFTNGLRFDPATDPRVFDGEVPMHDPEALTHLREVIGDGQRLFGTPDPDQPVASGSRPNRDWARLLGHDLTDATPEQYVRAYEAYRDGKIEKHERLTPAQREQVQRELREEVRQRAADLRALAELDDRYHQAVADLPENRQATIDRISREWAAAWTERERARSYIEDHAHELRVTPEELLSDDLKDGSALHDLFGELGSRTVRGENLADYRRRFEEFSRRHDALFEATRRFHDNDVRVADLDAELRAAVERDVELSEGDGDDGAAVAAPQRPPSKPPSSPGEGAQPPEPEGGDPDGAYSGATAPPRIESPTEWGMRMRAENASWDARMADRHALRMRELADEMVARDPDGPEGARSWAARMRADQAEWEARQAAQHADWLWKIVGDHRRPTEPPPSPSRSEPKPAASEPGSDTPTTKSDRPLPEGGDAAVRKSGADEAAAPKVESDAAQPEPEVTSAEPLPDENAGGESLHRTARAEGAQPDPINAALDRQNAAHHELRRIAGELGLPDHGNARDLEAAILRRIEEESAEHQATIARNDLRPDQWAAARDRAQQRLNELYGLRREMMRAARDYQAARIEERQLRAANPQSTEGSAANRGARNASDESAVAKPGEQPATGHESAAKSGEQQLQAVDERSATERGDEGEEPGADSRGDGTGGSPAKPGGDRPGGAAPQAEAEPGAKPAPDAAGGGTDGGAGGKPPTGGGYDDGSPPQNGDGSSENLPVQQDSGILQIPRPSDPPAPHGGERPAREAWDQNGPQREHRPVTRALRKALRDLADAGATRARAWTRMTARAHDLGLRPEEMRREILRETIARTADAAGTAPAIRNELRDLLGDLDRGAPRLEVDRRAARLGVALPSDHQVADAIRDRLAPPAQRRAELSIELNDRRTVDLGRLERLAREYGVDPEGLSRPELQRAVREAVNDHRDPISERQRRATVELVDRYRTAAANESARRAAAQHAAEREMLRLRAGFDDRGPRISGVSYRRFRFDAPNHMRVDGAPGERGRWVGVGAGRDPELRLPARERVRHAAEGFDAVYYRLELDHNGRIWVSEHHPASTEPVATRPEPARRPGDWIAGDEHEHEPSTRALRRQLRDLGAELGRRNDQADKNFAKIVQLAEHLGIDDAWRMRPRELAGAVRDLIVRRRARADELWNRADIPRADLRKFFEDRRAEEARAEETESLGKALLGLLRVHDQTLVSARDRVAADAALLAARDVLAGHEGIPLAADGRSVDPANPKPEVARLVPGRDGAPDRLVVVAPGANPDHVLDPAVRRAVLGDDGEFVFQQVRVDADGRVRVDDMHRPPPELDAAARRPAELEQPRRNGTEPQAPESADPRADGPRPETAPVADPQAALDAKVRERAHVAADLEFWRTKVDHRADPFGDVDLSRNRWSETLRQLRADTGRYVSDSAGPDSPDVARHEQLNPEQEREQTGHVDKLAEALDRLFHFEDRLDAIDREIHDLERRGARHDASQAEAVRDELGRVADDHRAAVQRAKPLRRTRDELSRLLDDPAQRTPENLRRLADAEEAVERAEHQIDRFNDERVALTGAWPDAVADHWRAAVGTDETPALRRISENVWLDHGRAPGEDGTGGRPARFIVVAGRAGFDHPDVPVRADDPDGPRRPADDRFDAPLLDALARHPDLAPLLKDPATSIDRLTVTGELAGGDRDGAGQIRARVETMAPVEIERTGLPARGRRGEDTLPFAGDTMVRWRGADGQWHDTREGQARGFRAYQPELPRGTKLDKYWQKEVDGWRLPPKGWAAFGGTDNSHIPYRQREEKMPDGFSGTLGAEPFQNMVEPLVLRLLTDHWPELSYEQILTLSEAGRAELWWHQGPGPKPEPPPGWDEEAHHGMPLDGALYTIGKRWVQLYDMARKHPWVLGPLQSRPEIGEWVRGHTTWLPDGAFDPDHPVLRKIPVVRSFRGWKGWRAGPRIDLQPPHRPWSAADHVPPRDRVEWSTPRQDRDVARWDAVQRWADRVIGRFADDAGNADVHRIVDLLTRARDPLLNPADPGGARLEALNLARHPDGTPLTRAELTERIQLVKDHLMRNEMWVRDHADPTGRMVKKTYDRLPHMADAWLRLTGEGDGDGRTTPYDEDLLLLDDAYVEAEYLADHDDATWHDADLEAARHGYDWDTNRRRLSGHLVIRDGVPVHPDELPPDAPEHDRDKTLRMSRIPYAVDAPAPDPSWLSPRERRAAEILNETDARQRFPGLPRDPVAALKELAARDAGPLRALPAPGARDPLLDLLLRAGRVEQLADAADPGERFVWAERLGEPEAAVEPGQLPETLRRLRGDLTRRLDDLDAAGPDERAAEPNPARPALDGTDAPRPALGDGTEETRTESSGADEHDASPRGGARREPGSGENGTDSESGEEDRAGTGRRAGQQPPDGGEPDHAGTASPRARDPRKPYITPVPHVPHNAEFEWPDYTPKRIDVHLPPAPIPTPPPHQPPPHQPPAPHQPPPHQPPSPHRPPHQPPRKPGPGQPGAGHHDHHGHDPDHHGDHRGHGHGHDHAHDGGHDHDGNDHDHGGHDHGGHDHGGHDHGGRGGDGGHEHGDHHHHDHDHHLPNSQAQQNIPVPPWLSDAVAPGNAAPQPFPLSGAGIERNVNHAATGLNPFGEPLGVIPYTAEPAIPPQIPQQPAPEPRVSDGSHAAIPRAHGVGQGPGDADRYGNGNRHGGTGYDPGAGDGNVHDRRFSVDRPFSLGDPERGAAGHHGVQPVPAAQPQNNFPQNGFPPFPPPMPNGNNAASASTPARHYAHPTGSPTPAPTRILVQEFNGHRCAEVDPLTGSLHESAEPMGPFSGVYGDLDGVEFVFFRTDDRLFLRVAGQLIDADDLAVIVHWQRAGRRHTEFTVTRAGLAVCTVRYRRRKPELDLGLWIRDVLDNPARRTQIFAEVRGVR